MTAMFVPRPEQELVRVEGQTFPRGVIPIDGFRFENCTFEHCTLVYRGLSATQFTSCRLRSVDWRFDGPAANTLNFLNMLAQTFGDDGRRLVEDLFHTLLEKPVLPEGSLVAEINTQDTGRLGAVEQAKVRKVSETQ